MRPEGRPLSAAASFPATVGLLALLGAMFALEVALGGSTDTSVLLRLGASFAPLVAEGQVWRLLTGALLHIGPLHLGMNALALWQLGRLSELTFGGAATLSLFVLTAITGFGFGVGLVEVSARLADAGVGWQLQPHVSAGASGALFGLEGALVAFFLRHRDRLTAVGSSVLRQLVTWSIAMMVISFVVPGIDWMAHLGGLLGGLAVGWALPHRPPRTSALARVAVVVSVLLLVAALLAVGLGDRPRRFEAAGLGIEAPSSWQSLSPETLVVGDGMGIVVAGFELPGSDPAAALTQGLAEAGLRDVTPAADLRDAEGGFLRRAFVARTPARELGGFVQSRCAGEMCLVVVAIAPGDRYSDILPTLERVAATAAPRR